MFYNTTIMKFLYLIQRSSMNLFISCGVIFACFFANASNEKVKVEDKKVMVEEVEDMFDEFALLKGDHSSCANIRNEVHKPPFIWPVDLKIVKHVIMEASNRAKIELRACSNVVCAHVGVVLSINAKEKSITIKHVVEGGTCYFTTIKNVDYITVPVGELIKAGTILGQSKAIVFEIKQMNVSIPPCMDMLLPPLNPSLVRVISKI